MTFLAIAVVAFCWGLAAKRPPAALLGLLIYFPFETVVVRALPSLPTAVLRFGSESIIYVILVAAWLTARRPRPAKLAWLVLALLGACVASGLVNWVDPVTTVLGSRQILRFLLVAVAVAWLRPDDCWVRRAFVALVSLLGFQALLGLAQVAWPGALVLPLMTGEEASVGGIRVREAVPITWELHRRVPGTLGRYDRMGHFLSIALLVVLSARHYVERLRSWPWTALLLAGGAVLTLTYSRAAWVALGLGVVVLGALARDRRVAALVVSSLLGVGLMLATAGNLDSTVDHPEQTLRERVLEMFAAERYRGSYRGLGRAYWIVNTVKVVVPTSPLLGVGPGRFGGGAAATLNNREVYDELGLPFGIYGTDGYIDNNWLSIVGETGLVGLSLYLMLLAYLAWGSIRLRGLGSLEDRVLGTAFLAVLPGFVLGAFLATNLEIRTIAPYVWALGGLVVSRVTAHESE